MRSLVHVVTVQSAFRSLNGTKGIGIKLSVVGFFLIPVSQSGTAPISKGIWEDAFRWGNPEIIGEIIFCLVKRH